MMARKKKEMFCGALRRRGNYGRGIDYIYSSFPMLSEQPTHLSIVKLTVLELVLFKCKHEQVTLLPTQQRLLN